MSTITLISIIMLCLLIGAILLLIWQRQKENHTASGNLCTGIFRLRTWRYYWICA